MNERCSHISSLGRNAQADLPGLYGLVNFWVESNGPNGRSDSVLAKVNVGRNTRRRVLASLPFQ